MPTTYQPKPRVTCFNCGDAMIKRRTSKSGRYYCPKAECQKERHADWTRDRSDARVRELQDKLEQTGLDSAAFVSAALAARSGGATCHECGFTNAPLGWAHFNRAGEGCGGLGVTAGTIHIKLAEVMFPEADRAYVDSE